MAKHMSKFESRAVAERPQEPEKQGPGCYVNGCPMAGSISESITGGGHRFCRYHFGKSSDEWAGITRTLRANQSLLGAHARLQRESAAIFDSDEVPEGWGMSLGFKAKSAFRNLGPFSVQKKETYLDYRNRLSRMISERVGDEEIPMSHKAAPTKDKQDFVSASDYADTF